jgi:hypothetical protein
MGRGISAYLFFILLPSFWVWSFGPFAQEEKFIAKAGTGNEEIVQEDCPTALTPLFTNEVVCHGDFINVPPDALILDNVDNPVNGYVVWDGDVTAPVFNPGATCDMIVTEFRYSIHCTTDPAVMLEGGIHTVEVWPEIQPPIITVDEFCNYQLFPFCPSDIVEPQMVDPGVPIQEFTVINPFGCSDVFMVEIPGCYPPIEVGEIMIIPVCNEYLVSFDIFGGTGNYVVNGTPLPPGQFNYISDPLICETPYSFDVTDDVMSSNIFVSGDGPDCLPTLETTAPTIDIIGNQYEVTFEIIGGTGNYSVNGTPVTGNVYVSDPINCGEPYDFIVWDNCTEVPVSSGGPVNCYDPIQVNNVEIVQNCNEYLVTFDIVGGTGNYVVNDVDLTPGQSNYASPLMDCETPYNFNVTDDVLSGNTVVSGDGPDCLPTLETTAPTIDIIGNQYEVTFEIIGGTGNYSVNGTPVTGNVYVSDPINCGEPYDFIVWDNCTEVPVSSGGPVNCYDPIQVNNVEIVQNCNEYLVTFDIVGGTGNYVVNDVDLIPGQSNYASPLMDCETPYNFNVTDDVLSGNTVVSGDGPDCLPTLETTAPTIDIIGNQYEVTFEIIGGTGNYSVNGTPVTGNVYVSDPINCGEPYDFIVWDNCTEVPVSSGGPVNCYDPIQVNNVEIVQNCNEYLVTFDIVGGTGNYVVNDVDLIPGQSNYASPLMDCETPYNFNVTDDVLSGNTVVSGDGPDCLPTLETTAPTIDIIGNQYEVTFEIIGGTGNYSVNGTPVTGNVYVSDPINCGEPYDFIVWDNCTEVPVSSGGPVNCYDPIQVNNVEIVQNCNEYLVTFDIVGGTGNYVVNDVDLTPGQSNYASPLMDCETPYNFNVTDDVLSGNTVVSGDGPDCLPTLETTAPTIDIIGNQYEVTFEIIGGTGNYSVNGTPVTGNVYVSDPINCGEPYDFIVWDNCTEVPVSSGGPVNCYDPIQVNNVEIVQNCNEYLVTFDIVGGTGNYVVNDVDLTPGQSNYASPLMDCETPYNFNVTDDVLSGNTVVSGDGPDCLPTLETTAPTIDIIGNQYEVTFEIIGGTGNYSVNGTPVTGNVYVSDPINCGEPYDFIVWDNCTEVPVSSGGPVNCYDPIQVNNVEIVQNCNEYLVTFDIVGGTGNYVVNDVDLTPGQSNYASPLIDCETPYNFNVTDDVLSGNTVVSGDGPDCLPTLETTAPTIDIIGNQYEVTFEIIGGTGNYFVNGTPVTGNVYVSDPINCGEPYDFIVWDNCTEVQVFSDPINCYEPITVINLAINQICNEYEVSFEIVGGTGNYVINGNPLPAGQSTVTSQLIPCGQGYIAEITDDLNTSVYDLMGEGPDCLPTFETTEPTIEIFDNQYQVSFEINGGTGTYFIDGNPLQGNTFFSSLIDCGQGYSFVVTDGCEDITVSGDPVFCFDPISITDLEILQICNEYIVSFTILGGTGNYVVNGAALLPGQSNVVSQALPCGTNFIAEITDDLMTSIFELNDMGPECLPALEVTPPITEVIGSQYQVSFEIAGGTGSYTVDGTALPGNIFFSDYIDCGQPYSFVVTDGCEDLPITGDSPACFDPISITDIEVVPTCNEYIVFFTISGGSGNYIVDETLLTPGQSEFVSLPLNCGTEFSFVVTDNVQSDITEVNGLGSECLPPIVLSEPIINISNQQYEVTISISGGTGNYNVDGNPLPGNLFISNPIPCGDPYSFELIDGCESLIIEGGPIDCYDPLTASEIMTGSACDQYTAQFTASGGSGNYLVDGIPLDGNIFISELLDCEEPFSFELSDDLQTGGVTIAGDGPDCPDPLETSPVSTGVIGNQYTAQFTPTGGSGNYAVDGIPLDDPIFISDPIPCGDPYDFELTDGCDNLIVSGGPIDCFDPLTVSEIMIGTVCNQYTAQFMVSGGTGEYLVDGLPLEGNSFISPLFDCGQPYNFDVTDDQQSDFVNVAGDGPDCPDPLETSPVSTGVIGNQYTAQFTPTGGSGNYAVDGIPLDGPIFISDPIPCGDPYDFELTDGCDNLIVSGGPVDCLDPLTVSEIMIGTVCNQYTAQFIVSGGTGEYLVDGLPLEGNSFISPLFDCGQPYNFDVTDDQQSDFVNVAGAGPDCSDPLETSPVSTGVIGNQYTAQFTPTGGSGNYAVDGIPLDGPIFISDPIPCGDPYDFELTDGCDDLIVSGGPVDCLDPLTVSEIMIGTVCNQYTAQFIVSGGTGEYLVDGLPLEGNSFISPLFDCGQPYNFDVTDDQQSDFVNVVGDGPDCPDPLETSPVSTGVIGNQYTAQFTPTGGSGNYAVDGIPLDGPIFISDPIPCGDPYDFELTDGCDDLIVSGGPVDCLDPLTVSEIMIGSVCNQYTAQFMVSGGSGNYLVDGLPLEGNSFISPYLDCGQPYNFDVTDDLQTGLVTVAGDGPDCPDPLETSQVSTGVIGNQYTAQFTPSGGSGNYAVEGIPLDGPIFISDPIPCGDPYDFELTDGCDNLIVSGGPIDCLDPLTVSEILIGTVCNQYTAQFTVGGGSGNYLVDGIPLDGNSFISPLLDCGQPYNFEVTDDQQSDFVNVAGDGPDCPDPLETSPVSTGVIGNQYTAQFTPTGGSGNYAVDGIPLDGPIFISDPIPCGDPYDFELTDDCEEQLTVAGDAPCLGCPTEVGDFSEVSHYCDGDTPVFPTEEAILATLDIASGEVFDLPVAEPLFYTGDGCTPQQYDFDIKVRCILDPTVILPAGTISVMLYPEPQAPEVILVDSTATGCIYEVIPSCPNDIVEPSVLDEVPAGTTGLVQTFEVYNEGCSMGLIVDVPIPDCIIDKVTDPEKSGALSMRLHNNPMSVYEAIILIEIGEKTEGTIQIWDMNGRLVRTISHQVFTEGSYTFYWDGNTDKGDMTPSGIYTVELRTDIGRRVAKLVKLN